MKKIYVLGIILSTLIIAFLIWLMVFIAQNGYTKIWNFDYTSDLHVEKEETVKIENINNINLDFSNTLITIFTTNDDNCKIIQKSNTTLKDDEKFSITQNGDSLGITGKLKWQFFSFGFLGKHSQIEIYLPEKYAQNLNIHNVSGDISINNDLILNYFEAKSVSGDIADGYSLKTGTYTISSTSGDINLTNFSGTGNLSTISGDIKINTFNILDNSTIKTTSGDINLGSILIKNELSVNTISGDIKLNFIPDANCKVNFSTVSGDISSNLDILYGNNKNDKIVNIGDRNTENSMKIKTVSGDLKIF